MPCTIRNGATEISVKAAIPSEIPWDRDLNSPPRARAKQIVFRHIGRDIARSILERRRKIDLRKLGQDPDPRPITSFENAANPWFTPAVQNVRQHHCPQTLPEGKKLADGFTFYRRRKPWSSRKQRQIGSRKLRESDTTFVVDRGSRSTARRLPIPTARPSTLELSVDGVNRPAPREEWWFVPVSSRKACTKSASKPKPRRAKIDARFGGP